MDDIFSDSEAEWTPPQGLDGLPIPGAPPVSQPKGPGSMGSEIVPYAGSTTKSDRYTTAGSSVVRSPDNHSLEPGVLANADPSYGFSGAMGSDVASAPSLITSTARVAEAPPSENSHSLGLALLLVSVGTGVGLKFGGTMGGVAGGLFGGVAVNALRAARCVTKGTAESDKEAVRSGTWALLGAALAGWLVYNEQKKAKLAHRNADEDGSSEVETNAESDDAEQQPSEQETESDDDEED